MAAFGALGVADLLDADEPVFWGTFSEEDCVGGGRMGCQSVGTWVSDDGSIRKTGVALDGRPDSDGSVRATYRPTGVINDEENNIVHVGGADGLYSAMLWVAAAGAGAGLALYIADWRRSRRSVDVDDAP